tara:strand:+ start:306 stop:494 length:189 start_codon:yes stop_codon:yes gene_type:complete
MALELKCVSDKKDYFNGLLSLIKKSKKKFVMFLIIGVMGAIISFLIWHYLRNEKFILRFEYM